MGQMLCRPRPRKTDKYGDFSPLWLRAQGELVEDLQHYPSGLERDLPEENKTMIALAKIRCIVPAEECYLLPR
jgi:hypothetical protein